MQQISFSGRTPPGPTGGAYSAVPDPLAGLRGPFKGRGEDGRKGKGGRGGDGMRWRENLSPLNFPLATLRHWLIVI